MKILRNCEVGRVAVCISTSSVETFARAHGCNSKFRTAPSWGKAPVGASSSGETWRAGGVFAVRTQPWARPCPLEAALTVGHLIVSTAHEGVTKSGTSPNVQNCYRLKAASVPRTLTHCHSSYHVSTSKREGIETIYNLPWMWGQ